MTDHRDAMKAAVEALDALTDKVGRTGFADSDEFAQALDALSLLRAALEAREPAGWKLVPMEPTPEMVKAYLQANDAYWRRTDEMPTPPDRWRTGRPFDATAESYKAMLTASPVAAPVEAREPDAWLWEFTDPHTGTRTQEAHKHKPHDYELSPGEVVTPLYASPVAADAQGDAQIDRDDDGELLIDWSPGKGRMVTLSLRADGRLSYAFTWDGEQAHGTAQMPAVAMKEQPSDGAALCAKGPGGCVAGECGKEEKRG